MRQKTSQIVYAYWNEVRGHRLAPRRLEIEPARIAGILPETFVLERVAADTFMFRLAGTRICEMFGRELRNTNFLADWPESDRITLERQLQTACGQGAAVVLVIEVGGLDRRYHATFEAILLPLLHTGETVTRVLGALSAIDNPAWLGHERLMKKRLIAHELIWPDGRPHQFADKMREPAPLKTSLAGARLVRFDRRSFRVLDGGRSGPVPDKS